MGFRRGRSSFCCDSGRLVDTASPYALTQRTRQMTGSLWALPIECQATTSGLEVVTSLEYCGVVLLFAPKLALLELVGTRQLNRSLGVYQAEWHGFDF